jgi:hypothetical protein
MSRFEVCAKKILGATFITRKPIDETFKATCIVRKPTFEKALGMLLDLLKVYLAH